MGKKSEKEQGVLNANKGYETTKNGAVIIKSRRLDKTDEMNEKECFVFNNPNDAPDDSDEIPSTDWGCHNEIKNIELAKSETGKSRSQTIDNKENENGFDGQGYSQPENNDEEYDEEGLCKTNVKKYFTDKNGERLFFKGKQICNFYPKIEEVFQYDAYDGGNLHLSIKLIKSYEEEEYCRKTINISEIYNNENWLNDYFKKDVFKFDENNKEAYELLNNYLLSTLEKRNKNDIDKYCLGWSVKKKAKFFIPNSAMYLPGFHDNSIVFKKPLYQNQHVSIFNFYNIKMKISSSIYIAKTLMKIDSRICVPLFSYCLLSTLTTLLIACEDKPKFILSISAGDKVNREKIAEYFCGIMSRLSNNKQLIFGRDPKKLIEPHFDRELSDMFELNKDGVQILHETNQEDFAKTISDSFNKNGVTGYGEIHCLALLLRSKYKNLDDCYDIDISGIDVKKLILNIEKSKKKDQYLVGIYCWLTYFIDKYVPEGVINEELKKDLDASRLEAGVKLEGAEPNVIDAASKLIFVYKSFIDYLKKIKMDRDERLKLLYYNKEENKIELEYDLDIDIQIDKISEMENEIYLLFSRNMPRKVGTLDPSVRIFINIIKWSFDCGFLGQQNTKEKAPKNISKIKIWENEKFYAINSQILYDLSGAYKKAKADSEINAEVDKYFTSKNISKILSQALVKEEMIEFTLRKNSTSKDYTFQFIAYKDDPHEKKLLFNKDKINAIINSDKENTI